MSGYRISPNALSEVIIIWVNLGNGSPVTTVNQAMTVTKTVTAGPGGAVTPLPGYGASTTAAAPAKCATHTVKVGGPGVLTFQPSELNNIPVGDIVVFEFFAQNHTVTQSSFNIPCKALAGGMDSGFLANPNNTVSPPPQVAMQVMTAKPLWFYCRQKGHCGKGMVFSINPTADKTHAMFRELAIAQNGTGSATPVSGGKSSVAPPVQAPQQTPDGGQRCSGTSVAGPQSSVAPPGPAPQQTPYGEQGGSGLTYGKGTVGADGSCTCVVACSAGSFPAVQPQGVGACGGMAGSLPVMDSMS
ncbi:uncharacterized protein UV8b_07239 [Ustilaginoidea virens]|uniref:Serine-threonine rich protein n=1 Tax=Ustilaginoidea virens TaxID=1159556 RepID=A0A8E5MJV0_USTVR|nr:uncharacterized protein UV8b_07239 [Ustilaginoidea virens]QUC22998.1 hypothetical protein UV8b_07239 [Ustilaginoidea virens]